jgi:hypothetical protein
VVTVALCVHVFEEACQHYTHFLLVYVHLFKPKVCSSSLILNKACLFPVTMQSFSLYLVLGWRFVILFAMVWSAVNNDYRCW